MKYRVFLLLIIAIMAIIFITIIIPLFAPFQLPSWYPWIIYMPHGCGGDPHKRVSKSTIANLSLGIELYVGENNSPLPENEQELNDIIRAFKLPEVMGDDFLVFLNTIPSFYRDLNNSLKEGVYWFDGWERPLRYKYLDKNEKGEESFMLYSYGSNGIDENGKGDDIAQIHSISIN